MFVINQRGEREPFSLQKVFRSAKRAGASHKLAQKIAFSVENKAFDGIKTAEIFSLVKSFLNKEEPLASLKFSLRDAMRKLGPTGFPFEKFIGRVLEKTGWLVKLNQIVKGKCVEHEIDCLSEKEDKTVFYLVECKYRNLASDIVDTQNILTLYAKFLDITSKNSFLSGFKGEVKALLATNAKFTSRAIKYANCVGVDLLGWNYPLNQGLGRLLDQNKLYPITILPSLNSHLLSFLNQKGIVLVGDLSEALNSGKLANLPQPQLSRLTRELKLLTC